MASWRCPGSIGPTRRTRKAIMVMRVDEGSSGGDRFGEEVAMALMDVVAIIPKMRLPNERFRKPDISVKGKLTGGDVVGVDVG